MPRISGQAYQASHLSSRLHGGRVSNVLAILLWKSQSPRVIWCPSCLSVCLPGHTSSWNWMVNANSSDAEDSLDVFSPMVETANWQQALLLLPTLSLPWRHSFCSRLLSRLSRRSQWQAAQSFFHALPDLGIAFTPGIYSAFLSSYAQKYLWQHSIHLLDLAESRRFGKLSAKALDAPVYNTVITSCARASKWQWSICLLDRLRHPKSHCKANLFSFNASLNACERRGLWAQALVLLEHMQEDRLTPDSASLNCTLSACEKSQQWQFALALLPQFTRHQCERTIVTYGAVGAACVVGSAWEAAIASMAEAFEVGFSLDEILLNCVAESCRRSWAWQQGLVLLGQGGHGGCDGDFNSIRCRAAQHAMDFAQRPYSRQLVGELAPIAGSLRQTEITTEKFEWTGRHPALILSDDWLSQANDLGGCFVRHSLECHNGFAQPGSRLLKAL